MWPSNKILQTLQGLNRPVRAHEISETTGLTLAQVHDAGETLVRNKLAQRKDRGVYIITTAGIAAIAEGRELASGPKGPGAAKVRKDSFRTRLWRALRIERKGTIGNIVGMILQPGENEAKAIDNAQKYFYQLCRARYVTRLPGRDKVSATALTSNGYVRYLLVVDNGPQAPVIRKQKGCLYDPNTKESVPFVQEVPHEP